MILTDQAQGIFVFLFTNSAIGWNKTAMMNAVISVLNKPAKRINKAMTEVKIRRVTTILVVVLHLGEVAPGLFVMIIPSKYYNDDKKSRTIFPAFNTLGANTRAYRIEETREQVAPLIGDLNDHKGNQTKQNKEANRYEQDDCPGRQRS